MKMVLLTNSLSPHQIPLAQELCQLVGKENFTYIYTHPATKMRRQMGWGQGVQAFSILLGKADCDAVLSCDVLLSGVRDMDVFLRRAKAKKTTFYMSERWFKPPWGMLRLLHPGFLAMCWKFMKLFQYECFTYLPIGIHAARDAVRLWKVMHGSFTYLFKQPRIAFEAWPGGKIVPFKVVHTALDESGRAFVRANGFVPISEVPPCGNGLPDIYGKMRMWGYFVENSKYASPVSRRKGQVLWVGRMDRLKHLPSIIRACKRCGLSMEIHGHGEDEGICRELAREDSRIHFHDYVSIDEVRKLMQSSEIYIFGSDGADGWGAVVNEALCEGMKVIGTIEAGASATMLPTANQFHSGDVEELTTLLKELPSEPQGIGKWTAGNAARALLDK